MFRLSHRLIGLWPMPLLLLLLFIVFTFATPALAIESPLRPNPFQLVDEESQKQFDSSKDQMTIGVAQGANLTPSAKADKRKPTITFNSSVFSDFSRFITPLLSNPNSVPSSQNNPSIPSNPLGTWLQWPSVNHGPGYFTSCYGKRCWQNSDGTKHFSNHTGIDVGYGDGSTIYTAASGVVYAASSNSSFGYYVIIDHQNGWFTIYGHMQPILLVSTGQAVTVDSALGYQDSSGDVYPPPSTTCPTCGSHLHFGISQGGSITDFFASSDLTVDPCSALPDCACDPNQNNNLDKCP